MNIKLDNENINVEDNKSIIELFGDKLKGNNHIIACDINNEIKTLKYIPKENDNVSFVDVTSRDGRRTYIRGLLFIMSMAFNECYPEAFLSVNYQLTNAMYCEVDNLKVTREMIENVSKKMKEIVSKKLDIKKVEMSKEEAIKFYEKENSLRGILQLDNEQKKGVSLYFCEGYYNYFYGVMPINTEYINVFEIVPYNDGILLRYPDKSNPNALEAGVASKKMIAILDEYKDIHRVLDVNTIYKLNKQIREGKAPEFVLLAEALHEKKISDIADNIINRKNVKVILIAGPSSSGKTTFAKRLGIQLRLNGLKPVTISVDDYFVERKDTPLDENGKYNFECIEAIDLKLFNDNLTTLLNGGEILCPTFDFKEGSKKYTGKKMSLAEDEVLVIEGIHCLNDKLTESIPKELKYKIYISALTILNIDYYNRISTTDSRLIRRMVRDYNFRGYTAIHTLQIWNSVNNGENQYIFPYQDEADSMFNTSLIYELCVLKKYALPMLEEIDNSYVEYAEAKRLCEFLKYFEDIEDKYVPENSILREFIGGSVFEY
ncbi:uridine kinase [Clostridium sp. CAG:567]|jgi:Uridine kinase|nr:uridine kinase [Clostridium sp. CAG:567]